ncbi:MAG: alpha/beta hydrolase [Ilumatobacteraceae bacterium]
MTTTSAASALASASPITITYGGDPSQFGQLWLPAATVADTPWPLVILIHGGFWRSSYGLDLMDPLAADLVARGFAAWNIEYRRVGQGGGYPATLEDVALAIDTIASIAEQYSLDLASTVVVGHSAGGHLALWSAGRATLPPGAPGADPVLIPRLAIGQGPVFDLGAGDAEGLGGGAVTDFIGGTSAEFPDRYDIATPSTTSGVPLAVVRGSDDDIVPERFTVPTPVGDVKTVDVPGDHFALIDPTSEAWQAVIDLIES